MAASDPKTMSIYFSATHRGKVNELCAIMGMPAVDNYGNYLGMPTIWGRSKRHVVAYVKD